MDIKIIPSQLQGMVRAIPSKSQAHRALICAALSDIPTRIECDGESDDITATMTCLSALGANIRLMPGGYTVQPLTYDSDNSATELPCGESGSTLRFLLPIAGALGRRVSFIPKGRLPERPLSPLYEELALHGCDMSPQGSVPFSSSGRLTAGSYSLNANVSSQFISGLLFALPLLEGDSTLRLIGQVESFSYIKLTVAMLEAFGIKLLFDGKAFSIPGGQKYRSPGIISVEGDWSNAAFWFCAGAISENAVSCTGLDPNSLQGDRMILDILSRFGAHIEGSGITVTVSGGKLHGVDIDALDIPDLVPVLAVVAAAAQGVTTIHNAGRLRTKESDRLAAITAVLQTLGADISETNDGLIIEGGAPLTGGIVSSHGDHRIAMSAAIAAGMCANPVIIKGAQAVNKSYPGFIDDFRRLGGIAEPL